MKSSDVLIVGGGPSGLRLAARLAGAGLDVRVLERKDGIGSSVVCTGIIGKEVFDSFGMNRDSALGELQTVRLVSPFGTSVVYSHPQPFAYVVDRERFDRNLAAEAASRGADIEPGHESRGCSRLRGGRPGPSRDEGGGRAAIPPGWRSWPRASISGSSKLGSARRGIPERGADGDRGGIAAHLLIRNSVWAGPGNT